MTSRLSDTRGMTLIEVLLVSTLFLIVLGATLTSMERFMFNNRLAEKRSDQVELARNSLDRMARQLRNLAPRVAEPTIRTSAPNDLLFQTRDPGRTWVRYCLLTSSPASSSNGRLYETVSETDVVPPSMTGSCHAGGGAKLVATNVTNGQAGLDVFRYTCLESVSACPASTNNPVGVTGVTATLQIDEDVTRAPTALRVSTAVFLRNQNEPPTARFTSGPGGGVRRVLLNASSSTDPEGRTLRFYWFAGATAPTFTCLAGPPTTAKHWIGATLTYDFPTSAPIGSDQPMTLVVCDPGDLQARYTGTVKVPS